MRSICSAIRPMLKSPKKANNNLHISKNIGNRHLKLSARDPAERPSFSYKKLRYAFAGRVIGDGEFDVKNKDENGGKRSFFATLKRSAFLSFLLGYERAEKTFGESGIKRLADGAVKHSGAGRATERISRSLYSSRIARAGRWLKDLLLNTSCRTYGAFMFSFGILTLLFFFAEMYFVRAEGVSTSMICGAVVSAVSMFLMISDKGIYSAVEDSALLSVIFFDFFGINRRRDNGSSRGIPVMPACFFGIVLAVAGFFLTPTRVIEALVAVFLLFVAFSSPEFCFTVTLISLPFLSLTGHGTVMLSVFVAITLLSYFFKVLVGKRIFTFEIHDFFILLFALCYLICGIFIGSGKSFLSALSLICVIGGYFIAANLLPNKRTALCAINALVIPSVIVSGIGIYQYYSGGAEFNWLDIRMEGIIDGRITSTLQNPNILAVYLLAVIVFSLSLARDGKNAALRMFYFALAALNVYALVLTWSRGAWVALVLALVVMLLLNLRRTPAILVILLALIPYSVYFVPYSVKVRIESIFSFTDTSIQYRLSLWKSVLKMIRDHLFMGSGVGKDAFIDNYPLYAAAGTETAEHAHNLFLQIAVDCGVITLAVFIAVLLSTLAFNLACKRFLSKSPLRYIDHGAVCAAAAMVINGATDYIWYNSQMAFLFWAVLGISVAVCRASRDEGIRGNFKTPEYDSFELDIGIRK